MKTLNIQFTLKSDLENSISFQDNAWSDITQTYKISDILINIANGTYKNEVIKLRKLLENGHKEKYNSHKLQLPCVTFSGLFKSKRIKDNLIEYTKFLIIDIDKLDEDEKQKTKEFFLQDPYILAFWESPSQIGIKALIKLRFVVDFELINSDIFHKSAFVQFKDYLFEKYFIEIDESGSDITRLCFVSYDPNLVINTNAIPFVITGISEIAISRNKQFKTKNFSNELLNLRNTLYNPKDKNGSLNRYKIQSIIKYLTKRKLSITNNYDSWYKVAYAISNSFTYDIGRKYYIKLCRLDLDKHDENASEKMLLYCYKKSQGKIPFQVITSLAKEKGYKKNKRGSSESADLFSIGS